MRTYNDIIIRDMILKGGDNMSFSPYTPSAGKPPSFLAGRDKTIENATTLLNAAKVGIYQQPMIFYGLRGVGKTVLLNKIEEISDNLNIIYEHIEAPEDNTFKSKITLCIQKMLRKISLSTATKETLKNSLAIFKAFKATWSPETNEFSLGLDVDKISGLSDTGDFTNDLTEMLVSLGSVAKKSDKVICLFLDEIQYLHEDELDALITSLHRCSQRELPIILFGAGLPIVIRKIAECKSYGERLFNFCEIDSLKEMDTYSALQEPAIRMGVSFTKGALKDIYIITGGYPYFIQEYGKAVWEHKYDNIINEESVVDAEKNYIQKLDESFFKARIDRVTPAEKNFMLAMVTVGSLPCTTAQIAEIQNKNLKSISPFRSQLIHKGLIYPSSHGSINFTVPQFDNYLRRTYLDKGQV